MEAHKLTDQSFLFAVSFMGLLWQKMEEGVPCMTSQISERKVGFKYDPPKKFRKVLISIDN